MDHHNQNPNLDQTVSTFENPPQSPMLQFDENNPARQEPQTPEERYQSFVAAHMNWSDNEENEEEDDKENGDEDDDGDKDETVIAVTETATVDTQERSSAPRRRDLTESSVSHDESRTIKTLTAAAAAAASTNDGETQHDNDMPQRKRRRLDTSQQLPELIGSQRPLGVENTNQAQVDTASTSSSFRSPPATTPSTQSTDTPTVNPRLLSELDTPVAPVTLQDALPPLVIIEDLPGKKQTPRPAVAELASLHAQVGRLQGSIRRLQMANIILTQQNAALRAERGPIQALPGLSTASVAASYRGVLANTMAENQQLRQELVNQRGVVTSLQDAGAEWASREERLLKRIRELEEEIEQG